MRRPGGMLSHQSRVERMRLELRWWLGDRGRIQVSAGLTGLFVQIGFALSGVTQISLALASNFFRALSLFKAFPSSYWQSLGMPHTCRTPALLYMPTWMSLLMKPLEGDASLLPWLLVSTMKTVTFYATSANLKPSGHPSSAGSPRALTEPEPQDILKVPLSCWVRL